MSWVLCSILDLSWGMELQTLFSDEAYIRYFRNKHLCQIWHMWQIKKWIATLWLWGIYRSSSILLNISYFKWPSLEFWTVIIPKFYILYASDQTHLTNLLITKNPIVTLLFSEEHSLRIEARKEWRSLKTTQFVRRHCRCSKPFPGLYLTNYFTHGL